MNEIEERKLIYSAIVAGKSAKFAQSITSKLFDGQQGSPFEILKRLINVGKLEARLRETRSGNYQKLCRCIPELIKVNPMTVTLAELESIHGIGPKTARFFLLWTRPGFRCAALDVHILRFLKNQGCLNVPKATPPAGPNYYRLEQAFLDIADEMKLTPGELDAKVWAEGAGYNEGDVWTNI